MSENVKELIREVLPRLLREDTQFRKEVLEILREELASREETNRILEEIKRLREDFNRYMREHTEELRKIWEEIGRMRETSSRLQQSIDRHSRVLEEHSKAIAGLQRAVDRHSDAISKLERTVNAVAARWGVISEESFREGMREILRRYGIDVKKWVAKDEEGIVFGHPSVVDVDVMIKDEEHTLVDIKSSVTRGDVAILKRIGEFYERICGVRPKLVIVSPFVRDDARELAEKMGIRIITGREERPSGE